MTDTEQPEFLYGQSDFPESKPGVRGLGCPPLVPFSHRIEFTSISGRCPPGEVIPNIIAALEKVWAQEGHDLSPEAPKGQRILWMKQQADRLDPMLPSPPSILDRKGELVPRWQSS